MGTQYFNLLIRPNKPHGRRIVADEGFGRFHEHANMAIFLWTLKGHVIFAVLAIRGSEYRKQLSVELDLIESTPE